MFRQLALIGVIVAVAGSAWASGWNDYVIELDDGYAVFRFNGNDTGVLKYTMVQYDHGNGDAGEFQKSELHYSSKDYPEVDSQRRYCVTSTHILTEHRGEGGLIPSNRYFIVERDTGGVIGPIKGAEFRESLELSNIAGLEWQETASPYMVELFGGPTGYRIYKFFLYLVILPIVLVVKYSWVIPIIWISMRIYRRAGQA